MKGKGPRSTAHGAPQATARKREVEAWRYYHDGKRWLLKVARKTKTTFWLSMEKGGFRVSFFFPERSVASLPESDVSAALKARPAAEEPKGTFRAVSLNFSGGADVSDAMTLVALKLRLK